MRQPLGLLLAGALGCSSPTTPTPAVDAAADLGRDATVADLTVADVPAPPDVANVDLGPGPLDPSQWSPRALGPYHVGYRHWSRTYTPAGTTTPRTINVHIWYPTLAGTGDGAVYFGLFHDNDSFVNAPIAAPAHAAGYPVHVYSHGHRGFAASSWFLMRWFASHGWVSVAPDHTGNTLGDTPEMLSPTMHYLRSRDVSSALDALTSPDAPPEISSRAVTSRAVLSGHSFGTHTVWSSLGGIYDHDLVRMRCGTSCTAADLAVFDMGLGDPRFIAGIPLAGSIQRDWFGPNGHTGVHVPMLAMSGTDDPVGADTQFASTTGVDLTWIEVRGGCHQFFGLTANACMNIPDALQGPIVGAWALSFARRHLLNDMTPTVAHVLDGTDPVSDRVTLHRR